MGLNGSGSVWWDLSSATVWTLTMWAWPVTCVGWYGCSLQPCELVWAWPATVWSGMGMACNHVSWHRCGLNHVWAWPVTCVGVAYHRAWWPAAGFHLRLRWSRARSAAVVGFAVFSSWLWASRMSWHPTWAGGFASVRWWTWGNHSFYFVKTATQFTIPKK